jgi:feruloyl esterase
MNLFNQALVFGPSFDYTTFDFDHDVTFMHQTLDPVPFDANDPNLSGLQQRGGKLIQYQGWVDYSVAPREAIDYYERVIAEHAPGRGHGKGERVAGLHRTQQFYRLFMAPGMDHCAFGPGPNSFGQIISYLGTPTPSHDAQHDILTALEQWVEEGIPPEQIIATKFVNDDATQGIQMQRPLCAYPKTAVYTGKGSTNDASNFRCKAPDEH